MRRLLLLFACLTLTLAACGGGDTGPGGKVGWEKGSEFDSMYDPAEFDKIKGYFQEYIEVTPMEGMSRGMGLIMEDRTDGEPVKVIFGPEDYVREALEQLDPMPGQKIKAYGCWAYIGGEDVLIATKLKKSQKEFIKVRRTSDGMPYWAMSPQEVAAENTGYIEPDDFDWEDEGAS
ncbi:hypothetical protein [Desulfohalovibrio reitneri]|uniref:hypothetical protein n=1 Tax=Desulfohalovibrio reitneri TaxID=1307759 RepID=UPI00054FC332|nr:hypothetical protein [Desulfohalovibrio reitneri]